MQETVPATFTTRPGYQLVPALIGRPESSIVTPIECPTAWCTEDHVDEHVRNIEDVMHIGETASVLVRSFAPGTVAPISLHVEVQSDPVATDSRLRAAHIVVQDGGGSNYCHLTEDMADGLADDLIALASELRQKTRTARLHNQTAVGDSDPDMDESLRRVRPWLELALGDVDTMPVSRLLKVFGVTVLEDGAVPDGQTAALLGKPGAMTLSYQRGVTQAEREQAVRGLLADHVAVSR